MPFKRGNLHQMVGRIERALQANEYALGVFFDIEGAFDNTSCQSVKQALDEKKVHRAISAWRISMLKHRIIMVETEAFTLIVSALNGLPQGVEWWTFSYSVVGCCRQRANMAQRVCSGIRGRWCGTRVR